MRHTLLVLLAPAALAAQQPGIAPPPAQSVTVGAVPQTPYDSAVWWIGEVGRKVAGVRSAVDQLRRAGYNFPDGVVRERLDLLQGRCRELARAASDAQRRICRGCVEPRLRPVLERYRAELTSVTAFGTRCATRMRQLGADRREGASDRARVAARGYSAEVARGLRAYEQRIGEVRVAFGWQPPAPQPRQPRSSPTQRP